MTDQTPCPNGVHVWTNQFGDDWTPDAGMLCDCRQKQWGLAETERLHSADCRNQEAIRTSDAEALQAGAGIRAQGRENFQQSVRAWVLECFGEVIADDMTERSFRFIEEALELAQSVGCTREQAHTLVDYVFNRTVGETVQEVGGVMVTLAAMTSAAGVDMAAAGRTELARISTPETIAKIRRKQASKRGVVSHAAAAALPGEWNSDPK